MLLFGGCVYIGWSVVEWVLLCYLWILLMTGGGFFFFKQKTAYGMRISDWSSDVCSSDLAGYRFGYTKIDIDTPSVATPGIPRGSSFDSSTNHEIGRASCRERVGQYV